MWMQLVFLAILVPIVVGAQPADAGPVLDQTPQSVNAQASAHPIVPVMLPRTLDPFQRVHYFPRGTELFKVPNPQIKIRRA